VRLNHEVQTFFDEAKPTKEENESEMGQDKDQEHKRDRQSDEARLLTLSDLEYIGVATAYVRTTGRDNQPYTIVGAMIDLPLPVKLQRQIRQVSIL
jgi:hypothetical protein